MLSRHPSDNSERQAPSSALHTSLLESHHDPVPSALYLDTCSVTHIKWKHISTCTQGALLFLYCSNTRNIYTPCFGLQIHKPHEIQLSYFSLLSLNTFYCVFQLKLNSWLQKPLCRLILVSLLLVFVIIYVIVLIQSIWINFLTKENKDPLLCH